jgi:hypothetical protein
MPQGQHRDGYRRPRTHEKRRKNQPLKIDRLPQPWQEQLAAWRRSGKSFEQVEELSRSLPWAEQPEARKLFPRSYVPETNLNRWWDLRFDQSLEALRVKAARAQAVAEAFLGPGWEKADEAARNALKSATLELMDAQEPCGICKACKAQPPQPAKCVRVSDGVRIALLDFNHVWAKLMQAQAAQQRVELEKEKLDVRRAAQKSTSPREVYIAAAEELLKKLRTRKEVRAVLDPISKELIEELSKSAESFAKRFEAQSA